MSGDEILNRYLRPHAGENGARGPLRPAEAHVAMVDLHLGDGRRVALPYATLLKIEFDPSTGITLQFATDVVTVSGRRLEPLYKGLLQHRVQEVAPAVRGEFEAEGPAVTGITCRPTDD